MYPIAPADAMRSKSRLKELRIQDRLECHFGELPRTDPIDLGIAVAAHQLVDRHNVEKVFALARSAAECSRSTELIHEDAFSLRQPASWRFPNQDRSRLRAF